VCFMVIGPPSPLRVRVSLFKISVNPVQVFTVMAAEFDRGEFIPWWVLSCIRVRVYNKIPLGQTGLLSNPS